ncbi:hypothetical protein ACLOJK_035529 [Asimina triloba]
MMKLPIGSLPSPSNCRGKNRVLPMGARLMSLLELPVSKTHQKLLRSGEMRSLIGIDDGVGLPVVAVCCRGWLLPAAAVAAHGCRRQSDSLLRECWKLSTSDLQV